MSEPETLLDEASPLGNAQAVVEDDGRVVYFYLHFESPPADTSPTRACWVVNRRAAPADFKDLKRGEPPLMPAAYCRNSGPAAPLDPEALRVVWFEEGNGAALFDKAGILAIIPPWSGMGGFDGYARHCRGEGPMAWGLPEEPDIHDRVRAAEDYWGLWDDDSFWESFRDRLLAPLEKSLGPHAKYYACDGGKWPPRALVRFDLPQAYVLVTLGMSLLPMPQVEMAVDDPSAYRRAELGAVVDRRVPEGEVKRLGSYLSAQMQYPWNYWTFLGDGHTMPCDSVPASCGGSQLPFVLLSAAMPGAPQILWPEFRGDRINLLWVTPISAQERDLAESQGSDALRMRLAHSGRTAVIGTRE